MEFPPTRPVQVKESVAVGMDVHLFCCLLNPISKIAFPPQQIIDPRLFAPRPVPAKLEPGPGICNIEDNAALSPPSSLLLAPSCLLDPLDMPSTHAMQKKIPLLSDLELDSLLVMKDWRFPCRRIMQTVGQPISWRSRHPKVGVQPR